jgi:hypothetical protein
MRFLVKSESGAGGRLLFLAMLAGEGMWDIVKRVVRKDNPSLCSVGTLSKGEVYHCTRAAPALVTTGRNYPLHRNNLQVRVGKEGEFDYLLP